jgi:hypothetical protein
MSKPRWHPVGELQTREFIERVHDELLSMRAAEGAAHALQVERMQLVAKAGQLGLIVKQVKVGRPFSREPLTRLDEARDDAGRLGTVFWRVWKKRNRQCEPSRARILAVIWQLSGEEEAELARHIDGGKNG